MEAAIKVVRSSAYGPDDIARLLKQRGRLGEFIEAIERQDRKRVAKLLEKVIGPDDGTVIGLYLTDQELLAGLRSHG